MSMTKRTGDARLRNPTADWPRLTKTLPQEHNRPGVCRSCGRPENAHPESELQLWQEHDHNDKPEARWLWLCPQCAGELIAPHVRLYSNPHKWAPAPGAMDICASCLERTGCLCASQKAKANGGPGIAITASKGISGFWDGRDPKTGRRTGGIFTDYTHPPSACSGHVSNFGTPPAPAPAR